MATFPMTFDGRTVTLSGPAATKPRALEALRAAGYVVLHDLPDPVRGLFPKPNEAYLRVATSQPDGPLKAVEALGWRLRLTSDTEGVEHAA